MIPAQNIGGARKKMKKISNKLIGGLMVLMLVAIIGVVIVSAGDDETNEDTIDIEPYFGCGRMFGTPPFFSELTEEQQEELNDIRENLREDGATPSEIREAIQIKLDEYGILDAQLDNAIERAEQQLEILNRKKDLREQGYSWEEIDQIIQDEFDLNFIDASGHDMMFHHHGPYGRWNRFGDSEPNEDTDL